MKFHWIDISKNLLKLLSIIVTKLGYNGDWSSIKVKQMGLWLWCLSHLQQYFNYIVAVSFIGGGNRSTYYHIILYWVNLAWAGFELTTTVVIGTDCIVSYKSNYHTIMTAPRGKNDNTGRIVILLLQQCGLCWNSYL